MTMQGWGLLWFDDNPKRTWPQKIAPAAARYEERFGQPVEVVFIHGDGPDQGRENPGDPDQARGGIKALDARQAGIAVD